MPTTFIDAQNLVSTNLPRILLSDEIAGAKMNARLALNRMFFHRSPIFSLITVDVSLSVARAGNVGAGCPGFRYQSFGLTNTNTTRTRLHLSIKVLSCNAQVARKSSST